MADVDDYLSLAEAAEFLELKYNTVATRVRRYRKDQPTTPLVIELPPGDDGGPKRVLVAKELLIGWRDAVPVEAGLAANGAERNELDHLRTQHEMSSQHARHLEIQLHHQELAIRDARIAELEQQIETERAEKAELHAMLVQSLDKYLR